jgi:uncharacterized protein (TIRG00374 family)
MQPCQLPLVSTQLVDCKQFISISGVGHQVVPENHAPKTWFQDRFFPSRIISPWLYACSEHAKLMRLRLVRYLIGIALLVGISILLFRQGDLLGVLRTLDIRELLFLLLLSAVIFSVLALQFRFMMRVFGLRLPFREWFGLTAVNSMFSYYFPARAGLLVRGAYLKTKYDFPVSYYTALVMSSQLILVAVTGLAGVLLVSVCGSGCGRFYVLLTVVFSAVTAGSIFFFMALPSLMLVPARFHRLREFMGRVKKGFRVWQGHYRGLLIFSVFSLLLFALRALRLQLCFYALDIPVGFLEVMIVQALLSVAFVVSITPGNLGVKEGLTVLCAELLGVAADAALAASLLDTAVTVLVIIVFGTVSTRVLLPGGVTSGTRAANETR